MLALMMCCLTGTLFVYQGQEIGMLNAPEEWPIEEYKDIESVNYYHSVRERSGGDPMRVQQVMKSIQKLGRDHARLPMQWDSSPHAGFTSRKEGGWMRIHDDYKSINVADQLKDQSSVLNFWKKMLKMRKEFREVFIHGAFEAFDMGDEKIFMFCKKGSGDRGRALVVLNFSSEEQRWKRPDLEGKFEFLVGNVEGDGTENVLAPWEGRVYFVK